MKKKIWQENFVKDYPSWVAYASLCRAWKVDMLDVVALKKKFGVIDKNLAKYDFVLRKRAIICPNSV